MGAVWQIAVSRAVANDTVGAATRRPRSEMLRIRIGLRRIRKILPLRAPSGRPYDNIVSCSRNVRRACRVSDWKNFEMEQNVIASEMLVWYNAPYIKTLRKVWGQAHTEASALLHDMVGRGHDLSAMFSKEEMI